MDLGIVLYSGQSPEIGSVQHQPTIAHLTWLDIELIQPKDVVGKNVIFIVDGNMIGFLGNHRKWMGFLDATAEQLKGDNCDLHPFAILYDLGEKEIENAIDYFDGIEVITKNINEPLLLTLECRVLAGRNSLVQVDTSAAQRVTNSQPPSPLTDVKQLVVALPQVQEKNGPFRRSASEHSDNSINFRDNGPVESLNNSPVKNCNIGPVQNCNIGPVQSINNGLVNNTNQNNMTGVDSLGEGPAVYEPRPQVCRSNIQCTSPGQSLHFDSLPLTVPDAPHQHRRNTELPSLGVPSDGSRYLRSGHIITLPNSEEISDQALSGQPHSHAPRIPVPHPGPSIPEPLQNRFQEHPQVAMGNLSNAGPTASQVNNSCVTSYIRGTDSNIGLHDSRSISSTGLGPGFPGYDYQPLPLNTRQPEMQATGNNRSADNMPCRPAQLSESAAGNSIRFDPHINAQPQSNYSSYNGYSPHPEVPANQLNNFNVLMSQEDNRCINGPVYHGQNMEVTMGQQRIRNNGTNDRMMISGSSHMSSDNFSNGQAAEMSFDNSLVVDLPEDLVQYISCEMDIDVDNNWRRLAALNGYLFSRVQRIALNKSIVSPFQHLLQQGPFSGYTFYQLKQDLEKLPRFDILNHLKQGTYKLTI